MLMNMNESRPLTAQIQQLRRNGATLSDLARRSGAVRSTSWFQNLCGNQDPWTVNAPDRNAVIGLAKLLNTTPRRINEMVAREWYGIESACLPAPVSAIAMRLETLDGDDLALIEMFLDRLVGTPAAIPEAIHLKVAVN